MNNDATAELESRIRRVEDLLEIQQLFVDYGRALDRGDFETFSKLFAEDGELLLGPVARARGRDEIRATMQDALAGEVGDTLHVISSPDVHLDSNDPDAATSEVMWTAIGRTPEGTAVVTMVGHHLDDLVREDGSWRIRRRRGFVDLPASRLPPG